MAAGERSWLAVPGRACFAWQQPPTLWLSQLQQGWRNRNDDCFGLWLSRDSI
jgi:hypothetical protein